MQLGGSGPGGANVRPWWLLLPSRLSLPSPGPQCPEAGGPEGARPGRAGPEGAPPEGAAPTAAPPLEGADRTGAAGIPGVPVPRHRPRTDTVEGTLLALLHPAGEDVVACDSGPEDGPPQHRTSPGTQSPAPQAGTGGDDGGFEAFLQLARIVRPGAPIVPGLPTGAETEAPAPVDLSDPDPAPADRPREGSGPVLPPTPARPPDGPPAPTLAAFLRLAPPPEQRTEDDDAPGHGCPGGSDPCREPSDRGRCRRCGALRSR